VVVVVLDVVVGSGGDDDDDGSWDAFGVKALPDGTSGSKKDANDCHS